MSALAAKMFLMNWVKWTGLEARRLEDDDVEDLDAIDQKIQRIEIAQHIHDDDLVEDSMLLVHIF